ncbi:hypothetical protein BR93DRAFT_967768 [Coniochaeta sp. PMI_546]|nr:hypothetical protein BR93DRAFT_967768 [Coniochaeta sp. PMI_546]
MDGGPSFASRRPAATGLPAFSLPPPDIPSTKYPASASLPTASSLGSFSSSSNKPVLSPLSPSASSQPVPFAPPKPPLPTVSSVLIPPSGVANDGLSPLSSGVNTGSSMGSQPGTTSGSAGANYSYIGGSWPTPQPPSGGSYSYTGAGNHNAVGSSPLLNQPFSNARSLYQQVSPSVPQFQQSSGRHISAPAIPDGIGGVGGGVNNGSHQISHTQGHAQSQTTPTSSGPPEGSFRAHQQQHHQQHQHQHQQHQHQQHQQQQQHHRQQESNQQQHQGVQYPYRTTPQQSSFPTFSSNSSQQPQPSPTARTPPTPDVVSASHAVSRTMSISGPGQMSGMAPPMGFASSRQGMSFGYQMSGPGGPIMTNMHQPGTPMVAVGNVGSMIPGSYNTGPSPHPHNLHVYGQSHPHPSHQDRPFKCDQCVQSFNRNHDLKRHKKIHLAVKPFPCTYCDKAFSRKDALKRHRLVKGCGERTKGEDANDSPPDRSDIMSDTTEGSPRVPKKEPM